MRCVTLLLTSLLLTACTWVKVDEEGQGVTVVSSAPESCRRLGTTTSITRAEIASIDRSSKKVATEMETLARNAAARMGGDTIVAESEVSKAGEQTFIVYRCSAP
jgi:hypothetical protein